MVFDGQDCAEDDRNNVALKLIANWSTGVKGAPMPRALHLRTAAFRTRMREIWSKTWNLMWTKFWRKCSKVFIHVDFSFDQRIWEYETINSLNAIHTFPLRQVGRNKDKIFVAYKDWSRSWISICAERQCHVLFMSYALEFQDDEISFILHVCRDLLEQIIHSLHLSWWLLISTYIAGSVSLHPQEETLTEL